MDHFTDANTDGFSSDDLRVLNAAYELLAQTVDPEFEADTHAISDGLNNAWQEGDTVETLVSRFCEQHPTMAQC